MVISKIQGVNGLVASITPDGKGYFLTITNINDPSYCVKFGFINTLQSAERWAEKKMRQISEDQCDDIKPDQQLTQPEQYVLNQNIGGASVASC